MYQYEIKYEVLELREVGTRGTRCSTASTEATRVLFGVVAEAGCKGVVDCEIGHSTHAAFISRSLRGVGLMDSRTIVRTVKRQVFQYGNGSGSDDPIACLPSDLYTLTRLPT